MELRVLNYFLVAAREENFTRAAEQLHVTQPTLSRQIADLEQDLKIVRRVSELAEKYGVKMQQIALAWQWEKGVAAPIVGATKAQYLDDAAGALTVELTPEDVVYLEECYVPHRIVGAIDHNPADGVMLLDEKK